MTSPIPHSASPDTPVTPATENMAGAARVLARIASGDRAALGELYFAHKDALFTIAFQLLGESASAEDVLHDVFVAFARRAPTLELEGSLRGYLIGSCLNRARDLLRQRKPEPLEERDLGDQATSSEPSDARAERDEEVRGIARLLATLPDEQREVVVLRVYGELSFVEIAALTGASVNTVGSRWRYAVTALEPRLTPLRLPSVAQEGRNR